MDEPLLQFFAYEHLPEHLQAVSKPFGELAQRPRRPSPEFRKRHCLAPVLRFEASDRPRELIAPSLVLRLWAARGVNARKSNSGDAAIFTHGQWQRK